MNLFIWHIVVHMNSDTDNDILKCVKIGEILEPYYIKNTV
jgi:hypothetical protein